MKHPLSPSYRLLLHAALDPQERAQAAWREWNSLYDLDTTEAASRRLLPLVHQNLSSAGMDDVQLKKLGGIRRYTWCENQLLFRHGAAALRALARAGIPTMALKGAPLALVYYGEMSLRPMRDLDLLVPPEKLAEAMMILRGLGWTPKDPWPGEDLEAFAHTRHAHGFANKTNQQIDLHGYIFPQSTRSQDEACFWEASAPLQLSDAETRCLNAADQFLHVCVHAATTLNENPAYWMADCLMILRSSQPLEIERLLHTARARRFSLFLRSQLEILAAEFPDTLTDRLLQELKSTVIPREERKEFHRHRAPLSRQGPLGMAQFYLIEHRRWRLRQSARGRRGSLLKFMQLYWQVPRLWQTPFHLGFRAGRKACRGILDRFGAQQKS